MAQKFKWSNTGLSALATGIDATQTTLGVTAGTGSRFPVDSFNLVIWNSTDFANPIDDNDREIVKCTSRATDTLTITRGQEGTTAVAHNTAGKTYSVVLAITQVFLDDVAPIPAGTVMVFFQAAPPTGWTQVTTQNDKALRVVSGAGGGSGGTTAFSAAWPAHNHTLDADGGTVVNSRGGSRVGNETVNNSLRDAGGGAGDFQPRSINTNSTGAASPQFIDVIVASRD